jgi:WD40 repeat protein
MLIVCTAESGVIFFELDNDTRKSIDCIELDMTMIKFKIKSYMNKCILSPNKQFAACVTGLHNSVYLYDLYSSNQSYISVSTYPECCDQLTWSNDSSIIVAYKKDEPSAIYAVYPCTQSSQKIALIDCKYETLLVYY